jgi:hypothetical protein
MLSRVLCSRSLNVGSALEIELKDALFTGAEKLAAAHEGASRERAAARAAFAAAEASWTAERVSITAARDEAVAACANVSLEAPPLRDEVATLQTRLAVLEESRGGTAVATTPTQRLQPPAAPTPSGSNPQRLQPSGSNPEAPILRRPS